MRRILITGAAGFIGSHLCERLLELGFEVVGVDGFTDYYARERKRLNVERAMASDNFRLVAEDLLETDLGALLDGIEAVVHLAAEPGVRASWGESFARYLRRNVQATQRLLEAASGSNVGRLVFASSSSTYGSGQDGPIPEDAERQPASPYGLSKFSAEELVALYARERGLLATSLRYFTVYGPRQRPEMALSQFIERALWGSPITIFGDGRQMREMTYVSDVVDATVAALEVNHGTPHRAYNVGGGSRATVNELVGFVQEYLRVEVEVERQAAAAGDVRSTWADLSRARRELSFEPSVRLEDGIREQAEWVIDNVRKQ